MTGTLWLGNLPERLDPARDVVFSAAALACREADLVAYAGRGRLAASQFNAEDMIEAEAATQRAYREVAMPYLAQLLKQRGEKEFSPTALSILAGPWLMFLLHTCWLSYRTLERHIAALGDAPVVVVAPEGPPFAQPPADSLQLVALMIDSDFQAWVASRFLRSMKPPAWTVSAYLPARTALPPRRDQAHSAWRVRLWQALSWGRCTSEQLPVSWRLLFGAMLALRKVRLEAGGAGWPPPVPPAAVGSVPESFVAELAHLLDTCTPTSFTEELTRRAEGVRSRHRFRRGFGRLVGSSIYDDAANLRKALACEAGEVVLSVQHGGGYGTHCVFPLSPESEYLGGPFISWGWTRHNDYAVRALDLPSPALSRLAAARRRARRGRDVVFVGGDMNPGVLRVHSKPNGAQWLDYRQQKVDFLAALSAAARNDVLYRGYYTGNLGDDAYLRAKYPTLRICGGSYKEFRRHLLSAAACVVDHPITTLHQTLAMNLPTIAYWNPDHWGFSTESTPLFAELEGAGILHRSGEAAGRFLDQNFERIGEWWDSAPVQAARSQWCHRYARTSRHWVRDWIGALWGGRG